MASILSRLRDLTPRIRASKSLRKRLDKLKLRRLKRLSDPDNNVYCTIHGSKMRLNIDPHSQHKIEHELAIHKTREHSSTVYFQNRIKEIDSNFSQPPLVLDIGANIGYYSLISANSLRGDSTILAIEAEQSNIERLEYNIALNKYTNITPIHCGIGESNKLGKLSLGKTSNTHNFTSSDNTERSYEEVWMTTVDDLINKHRKNTHTPIIVRMDIEGYEGYAFRGMQKLLASGAYCFIFFELHKQASPFFQEIKDALQSSGFQLEAIEHKKGNSSLIHNTDIGIITSLTQHAHLFLCRPQQTKSNHD
ncbi:FkbM family methyltransferase [Halorhodospira halochloris]|uniref:FkbM family methyltransferase n=1 Tax=Halorhodospira halochloris TaxID=1052 RepID=UPI001EE900DA|nr:FkbM family methyltransferase [Halorhodospira halochloris]MCG5531313.1 FkbM family methyltransferase [Halorhodospira halochloris]